MRRWTQREADPAGRLFPPAAADLYDAPADAPDLSAEARAARRVLALGRRPLRLAQRHGWGLAPIGRVARLLHFHRLGLAAEVEGRTRRADFYWKEVQEALRRLPTGDPAWAALAKELGQEAGVGTLTEPYGLRRRVVEEVLLDTHIAFYNGRLQGQDSPDPGDRAFRHAGHLDALLPVSAMPVKQQLSLMEAPILLRLARYRDKQRWGEGVAFALAMARRFPKHLPFQEQLAEMHFAAGLAEAPKRDSEGVSRLDAAALGARTTALEKLRAEFPCTLSFYEVLAYLEHLRAIKLANGDRPSQALEAAERALTYKPGWQDARESVAKVEEMLAQLGQRMAMVRARLGTTYMGGGRTTTTTLSAEGYALQSELDQGTKPRDRWRGSEAAKKIGQDLRRARARALWVRMGLPEPADRWDERAAALDEGTDLMLAKQPTNAVSLFQAWHEVLAERPDLGLQDLDAAAVCGYFLKARDGGDAKPEEAPPPLPDDAPRLAARAKAGRLGGVPFDFWLLSRRDLGLKGFVAAALALVVLAGVLTLIDRRARAVRDAAYARMVDAAAQLDDQAAVAAANEFFSVGPISGKDERRWQVGAMQKEAAEWPARRQRDAAYARLLEAARNYDAKAAEEAARAFDAAAPKSGSDQREFQVHDLAAGSKEWPNRRLRDEAYQQLLKAVPKDDLAAVVRAGEQFLGAPPLKGDDPRRSQVLGWYTDAFARWFARLDGDPDPDSQARIDRYRALVSASKP